MWLLLPAKQVCFLKWCVHVPRTYYQFCAAKKTIYGLSVLCMLFSCYFGIVVSTTRGNGCLTLHATLLYSNYTIACWGLNSSTLHTLPSTPSPRQISFSGNCKKIKILTLNTATNNNT